jgi:predicted ribonuclease YlaK
MNHKKRTAKAAPAKVSVSKKMEVKDNSPYVFQRDKINVSLSVKDLPWTEKQKNIIQLFLDKGTKALFLKGPAGTGKTLLAMYCGLTLLNNKRVSDLVLVRAAVESADSKLGYLPGTQEEKLSPHHLAFQDKLSELLIKPHIAALVKDERLTSCPINFARGLHFAAKFVCVDEYQNLTRKESLLMLSRIGEYSKVFLCGDPEQSDLPYGKSSFVETYNLFNNEESRAQGIFCVELNEDDIVRSEFCKFITKKFRELPPLQHNSKH